ncbi:tetratricopeptide repeat protein [Enhygromyxa salina]|uniref:tetratricopeptide repeat protein n=1 Tax=Enhygromyxa salina TaxID=215803 RepID=UPI0015E60CF7|nr:tetratricopeptide repeat protein [Enhygromyxa salina]
MSASGCDKKGSGTKTPRGMSKEDVEAEKEKAKTQAKVNQLIVQANEALGAGRYVTARKIAEDALAENPDNADAYVVLGAANWRAGDFDASTEALRKAMELDPTNFGGGVALSRNLRAASLYDESLAILEPVIAAESEGFQGKSCEQLEDCEEVGGWCDTEAKVCKPPVLVDTRAAQLWAYYMTLDTEKGPAVADEVFLGGAAAADVTNDAIRGYADFLRAFAGKGELVVIEGETGTGDLGLDIYTGLTHSFAVVGGEPSRALFSPLQIESRIDKELADSLGLEPLGKTALLNLGEYEVTLIPEVEFKGIKIKNVPALIDDLAIFSSGLPDKAGVILGHQALHKIGSIVADYPNKSLTITKAAPSAAPAGAAERPLVMLDQWSLHVPATPITIDSSDHTIWAWLGYANASAVTLTAKSYLKSGHLPREIENPEDPDNGRKMVYVDQVSFGSVTAPGMGGLVYLEQPGEPQLAMVRGFSGFELGGFVNVALLEQLKVTYAYGQGKIWIEKP